MRKSVGIIMNSLAFWIVLYCLITILISTQSLLLPLKTFSNSLILYTHYNNYIIFKQSYFHLIQNKDLYQLFPNEQWDYYKYSPTFALFMGSIAYFPDFIGLTIWNISNVLILLFAIWKMPMLNSKKNILIIFFMLIELITATQNSQSNALMAGLVILTFIALEKDKYGLAAFLVTASIFIKIFGLVAIALFIFYPKKWKAILYLAAWGLCFTLLPLLVVDSTQLIFLYKSWLNLLLNDHSVSYGFSVAGFLQTWFNVEAKKIILISGMLLFLLPLLLKYKHFNVLTFKLLFLANILIWVIIFNHKAESPTFIIAISGAAIWYFSQAKKIENFILLILALIFTMLSPTDLFPRSIKNNYFIPYVIKAVPCILIWCKIIFDLLCFKSNTTQTNDKDSFLNT